MKHDKEEKSAQRLILRKEYFGGIFKDMDKPYMTFLNPGEYETKKRELIEVREAGKNVRLFDATERGYPLLKNAASSPLDTYLELTKRCNGACKHCFADSIPSPAENPELPFSDIEALIRQLAELGGMYVRLTGGEPTIREDFFDIVDVIREEGLTIGLNTNGLFGEKTFLGILSRDIGDIRISLDGPQKVNDRIRTEGSYIKVIQTLENIAQHNRAADKPIVVTLNVVLMKSNRDYIEDMIALAQNFNAQISFGLLRLAGRAKREEMLTPEEVVIAAYRVQEARDRLGLPRGAVRINYDIFCCDSYNSDEYRPFPFDNSKCPIGTTGYSINAYGRIAPCGYMVHARPWIGEDARGKDLLDLWHTSKVLIAARQVRRRGCAGCEYYMSKCNGGCPFMAYVFEGDIDGQDPYCVRNVGISDNGLIKPLMDD